MENENAAGANRGASTTSEPTESLDHRHAHQQIVDDLTRRWLQFDDAPPIDLLHEIASRFDVDVAATAITDVGRAGRLPSYREHILGFVRNRHQAHLIAGEVA